MLGLSGGIPATTKTDRIVKSEIYSFVASVDPWVAYSVTGTLTMQAGQSAPSSGHTDWMKCTFYTNQTDVAGIKVNDWTGGTLQAGDKVHITYDIHIVNDSGKWDPEGDADSVSWYSASGGTSTNVSVPLDTTTTVSHTQPASSDSDYISLYSQVSDDLPQAGAVFYIRNIHAKVKRP